MKQTAIIVISCLSIFIGAATTVDPAKLFYSPAIQQVFYSTLIVTVVFRIFTGIQISKIWHWIGIPLGITSSATSLVSLVFNATGPDGFEEGIANSILGLGYGLLVSMFGFLVSNGSRGAELRPLIAFTFGHSHQRYAEIIFRLAVLLLVLLCVTGPIVENNPLGFVGAFDFRAMLIIFGVVLSCAYFSDSDSRVDRVLTGFVFGCLASVFVGLIGYLFAGLDSEWLSVALAQALIGLSYSGIGFVVVVLMAQTKNLEQSSISLKNWHMLEIYSLWVLMLFAPISLREFYIQLV